MASVAAIVEQTVRAAGIPITGVSIGDQTNRATWRVAFAPEATDPQKAQAQTIVDTVVIDAAAQTDADADADLLDKKLRTLVVYIWRLNHSGQNPNGAQLNGELATLKAIWKNLP